MAGRGRKSKIFIGRHVFENPEFSRVTSEDLKHLIVEYQYQHAVQHAEGPSWGTISELQTAHNQSPAGSMILYTAYEIDALAAGFDSIQNCSNVYIRMVKDNFRGHRNFLQHNIGRATPLQQRIMRAALDSTKHIDLSQIK